MPRSIAAVLLFCSLPVLLAAPVPPPRPWVIGWGRPIDPRGDCRFDRSGDKLAITVPGKGHALDPWRGRLTAPRLLREVEGDFAVRARLTGLGHEGERAAGLLLVDGMSVVKILRVTGDRQPIHTEIPYPDRRMSLRFDRCGVPHKSGVVLLGEAVHLRMTRRGGDVSLEYSGDGLTWGGLVGGCGLTLKRRVKVGVVAESTAGGPFTATFDNFKLTPLGGEAQRASP